MILNVNMRTQTHGSNIKLKLCVVYLCKIMLVSSLGKHLQHLKNINIGNDHKLDMLYRSCVLNVVATSAAVTAQTNCSIVRHSDVNTDISKDVHLHRTKTFMNRSLALAETTARKQCCTVHKYECSALCKVHSG